MEKEIKYIGFYDLPGSENKRVSTLAATNKMDYICDAINRAGFKVHLVSPSWYNDNAKDAKFQPQATIQLSEQKRITFCPSWGTKRKWARNLKIVFTLVWLFIWLIWHVRRTEKILVYHVQWLSIPIRWAKRIKGFKLILEVEEIYEQVWDTKNILQKWEQKQLKSADYYIAVSDVLADILGNKVEAIIYGNYSIPIKKRRPMPNGIINVIYAGSIECTRGGAYNAIKCAKYLSKEYIINICGFGNKYDLKEFERLIISMNTQLGRNACIYHGIKTGKDYTELLSYCQIAINPQFEGKYMNTAFPSKVISYLSHNLRVVSTRIKSIEQSSLSSLITFSENDSPESIALSISNVKFTEPYNSISFIKELDMKFIKEIKTLLTND